MANRWESSQRVLGLIDCRWTLAVLTELRDGGRRYQELDEALDSVSQKVLTDTLRRAERDGLVARQLDPGRLGWRASTDGRARGADSWSAVVQLYLNTPRPDPPSAFCASSSEVCIAGHGITAICSQLSPSAWQR